MNAELEEEVGQDNMISVKMQLMVEKRKENGGPAQFIVYSLLYLYSNNTCVSRKLEEASKDFLH